MDQPQQGHLRHLPLRDESLEQTANLPDLNILAQGIYDDVEPALEQFREIATDLKPSSKSATRARR